MNANKVIHEAMGLCWHEAIVTDTDKDHNYYECVKCREDWCDFTHTKHHPDYTDPVHYCALMDWMREGDKWLDFHHWYGLKYGYSPIENGAFGFHCKEPLQQQINLIAEAIEAGVFK